MFKKILAEFIATFFLILVICMVCLISGGSPLGSIAIFATLTGMIYATAHISGAHLNPAMTLALVLRGKSNWSDGFPYILAHVIAAVAAPLAAQAMLGTDAITPMPKTLAVLPSLLAEFLGTFALGFTVLQAATHKATSGNVMAGLAISLVVLGLAISLGPVSGAAFNPAVGIALCAMGITSWDSYWIYLVATLGGAALSAIVFNYMHEDDAPKVTLEKLQKAGQEAEIQGRQ